MNDCADKFLSELKELIKKYNASIDFSCSYCYYDEIIETELEIYLNNKMIATSENITELNLSNVDKLRRVYE